MSDQATRHALIKAAVSIAGAVPTLRAMQDVLALDGIRVSRITICRDYHQLGYRSSVTAGRKRTGETTISVKYFRLPVSVYDACCQLASDRKVPLAHVIRAMVSVGVRHTMPRRIRVSKKAKPLQRSA